MSTIQEQLDWLTEWCEQQGGYAQYRLDVDETGVDVTVWGADSVCVVATNGPSIAHALSLAVEKLSVTPHRQREDSRVAGPPRERQPDH